MTPDSTTDAARGNEADDATTLDAWELVRMLVASSRDALLVIRASDGVIVESNDRWGELLGAPRHSTIGSKVGAAVPWIHRDDAAALASALASGTRTGPLAMRVRRASGSSDRRDVVATVTPARIGDVAYRILALHERPARSAGDEHIEPPRRLEELGRLAAAAAHDMNNLLTVIRSYAALMLDQHSIEGHMAPADAAEIERAAARGSALTRRLLAFAKRETIEPQRMDLADAIRALEGTIRPLLGERVTLHLRLEPGMPPILAEPIHVDQVLLNLATNAIDAMPEGGQLTIAVRRAADRETIVSGRYTDGLVPPDAVVMEVSDSGDGMDAETLARAFEPFFSTKAARGGTGLGLSVISGILRGAGGAIDVSTAPGLGTTFTVYWPVAPAIERRADEDDAPLTGVACVLVVEDDVTVRHLMRRVLVLAGYDVVAAPDGRAARERFDSEWPRGTGPAIVLADIATPHEDGWTLARWLSEERPGLPVVLVSALDWRSFETTLPRNVAVPIVQKPFEAAELLEALRTALVGTDSLAMDE